MLGRIGWVSRITKKGSEVTAIRVCALIEVDSLIRADDSVRVEETAKVFVQPRFGSTTWVTQVILGQVSQVKQEKRPPLVMLWTKAKRSVYFPCGEEKGRHLYYYNIWSELSKQNWPVGRAVKYISRSFSLTTTVPRTTRGDAVAKPSTNKIQT